MKKDAINITVSFVHNDKPYAGVTVNNGVNLSTVPAPCGKGELLSFGNTSDAPTGILVNGVSAVDVAAIPFRPYLQLRPTVVPIK